jgi:hypothetical protein
MAICKDYLQQRILMPGLVYKNWKNQHAPTEKKKRRLNYTKML